MKTDTKEQPAITPQLKSKCEAAARQAYNTDSYGNGVNDWQSAEVAACSVLQSSGFTNEEAYEEGRQIAAEVVRQIDDAAADQYEKESNA
jgi:hypothetical protein